MCYRFVQSEILYNFRPVRIHWMVVWGVLWIDWSLRICYNTERVKMDVFLLLSFTAKTHIKWDVNHIIISCIPFCAQDIEIAQIFCIKIRNILSYQAVFIRQAPYTVDKIETQNMGANVPFMNIWFLVDDWRLLDDCWNWAKNTHRSIFVHYTEI